MDNFEEQTRMAEADQINASTVTYGKKIRVCLVGDVVNDASTVLAAQSFAVPIVQSSNGLDLPDEHAWQTCYILDDFDGPMFETLNKNKQCIVGPPALKQLAAARKVLGRNTRPVYNYAMQGVVTCFTGIRRKDELTKLVNLIHSMGGCIRKDMNSKITHLISTHSSGEKYQYAKTFRLAVVRPSWVIDAWEHRNDNDFSAVNSDFSKLYDLKPFEGQKICFHGFATDEQQDMIDVLKNNGGTPAQLEDVDCSHVIVYDQIIPKVEQLNCTPHILKSDWFWYTVQNGYADETDYQLGEYTESFASTPNTTADCHDSLAINFNKRKRKRFSQRLQREGNAISCGKRRSSVSDAGLLSVSSSFFDCTTNSEKLDATKILTEADMTAECDQIPDKIQFSMRFNHFMDFFNTESNYVGILDTIVKLFKNPLEDIAETNDAILNKSEIREIFANFIPIYDVHQSMLECLRNIHSQWNENCLIGDIILQHRDDLIKAYPPYINYFERMKDTLLQCDDQKPRFHAFLKINQAKPECGRQSLQDLMIRPVQRLPSISLLLSDILKHTSKSNADHQKLDEALKAIKDVMMHINEDKRRTESRVAMFDIFNDIEGCPADLVSSNRCFISRCEVSELSDNLRGRGDTLILYLFTDTIEVCKKRSRGFNSTKSPSNTKGYKHIKLISLNAIRYVIDITDSPTAFALVCRQDKDKLYSFNIYDEEIDKATYLKVLCKQMADNACRTDTSKALVQRTSQEMEVDISNVNSSTLSKAFRLAARTRLKVGRAFSFNKTPSKLKRALSTMMTSPFGSTNSLTPSSQLAQMRLASCANIHEVMNDDANTSVTSIQGSPPPVPAKPTPKSTAPPPQTHAQPVCKKKTMSLYNVGRI